MLESWTATMSSCWWFSSPPTGVARSRSKTSGVERPLWKSHVSMLLAWSATEMRLAVIETDGGATRAVPSQLASSTSKTSVRPQNENSTYCAGAGMLKTPPLGACDGPSLQSVDGRLKFGVPPSDPVSDCV